MVTAKVLFVLCDLSEESEFPYCLFSKNFYFIVLPRIGELVYLEDVGLKVVSVEHYPDEKIINLILEDFKVIGKEKFLEEMGNFVNWGEPEKSLDYPFDLIEEE